MEAFKLSSVILILFVAAANEVNSITTTHHDKPENSKLPVMASKMKSEENTTSIEAERHKRLLPYMTFYLDHDFNRPYQQQQPQRYQVPQKQTTFQQFHNKFNELTGGANPVRNNLTPFLDSNALPGPFHPMRGVVQVPQAIRTPNYSAIYDKLSQLKLQQQQYNQQVYQTYAPVNYVRTPQYTRPVNYEQIIVPVQQQQQQHIQHLDHVQPATEEEKSQYIEDQRYNYDVKKQKPIIVVRQKTRLIPQKPVLVIRKPQAQKPYTYESVQFNPIKYENVPKFEIVNDPYKQSLKPIPIENYDEQYKTVKPGYKIVNQPIYKPETYNNEAIQPIVLNSEGYKIEGVINKAVSKPFKIVTEENYQTKPVQYTDDYQVKPIVDESYNKPIPTIESYKILEAAKQNYKLQPVSINKPYETINKPYQPQYNEPIQYSKPYNEPINPQYSKPINPQYNEPINKPYSEPNNPQYNQPIQPTAPTYIEPNTPQYVGAKYAPQYPENYDLPIKTDIPVDDTNSLSVILKKLQETNALPQTLTPDNIDNSIRTLVKILSALKRQQKFSPIVVPDESGEYEEDIENEAGVELGEGYGPGGVSHIYPENTPEGGTPGKAGVDYPALYSIPQTSFNCKTQRYKGFFGDPDTNCQVWHYCDLNGGQASFLCPNGTIFSQVALTCDWWYNVKCSNTPQLYVLNERLYKYILPLSPKFPEDYSGPLVDRYLAMKFQEMEEKMKKERKKNKENSSDDGEESEEPAETDDADELSKENKKAADAAVETSTEVVNSKETHK